MAVVSGWQDFLSCCREHFDVVRATRSMRSTGCATKSTLSRTTMKTGLSRTTMKTGINSRMAGDGHLR